MKRPKIRALSRPRRSRLAQARRTHRPRSCHLPSPAGSQARRRHRPANCPSPGSQPRTHPSCLALPRTCHTQSRNPRQNRLLQKRPPTGPTPPRDSPMTGHGDQPSTGAVVPPLELADQTTSEVVISGHGGYTPVHGPIAVPPGTAVITYAEHGSSITDALGNLIETHGDTSRIFSEVFRAGELLPDHTIYPPDGLNILGDPRTVLQPTRLSEMLEEDMGNVHLAVCTYDGTCPTGRLYDIEGIWDESTGELTPYERHGSDAD